MYDNPCMHSLSCIVTYHIVSQQVVISRTNISKVCEGSLSHILQVRSRYIYITLNWQKRQIRKLMLHLQDLPSHIYLSKNNVVSKNCHHRGRPCWLYDRANPLIVKYSLHHLRERHESQLSLPRRHIRFASRNGLGGHEGRQIMG